MIETAPAPGTYKGKTADQWRAQARVTDASSPGRREMLVHRCEMAAQLAESDGLIETEALFDTAGNLVPACHRWNKYGDYWEIIRPGAPEYFTPSRAQDDDRARAANARRGYYVGTVKTRGKVTIITRDTSSLERVSFPATVPERDEVNATTVVQIVDNGH